MAKTSKSEQRKIFEELLGEDAMDRIRPLFDAYMRFLEAQLPRLEQMLSPPAAPGGLAGASVEVEEVGVDGGIGATFLGGGSASSYFVSELQREMFVRFVTHGEAPDRAYQRAHEAAEYYAGQIRTTGGTSGG